MFECPPPSLSMKRGGIKYGNQVQAKMAELSTLYLSVVIWKPKWTNNENKYLPATMLKTNTKCLSVPSVSADFFEFVDTLPVSIYIYI